MSNRGVDRAKERLVKVSLEIPTYGTKEQAEQTAERATKEMAVRFATTLTGKYKNKSFTYTARGSKVPDEPQEEENPCPTPPQTEPPQLIPAMASHSTPTPEPER
jgi:hypothetical protein